MRSYFGWDWVVRCYYADDVQWPRTPGELASETVHKGDHSKDMEVAAGESLPYIGSVVAVKIPPSGEVYRA